MSSDIRLLMIGAMYENGGNTTHRHLDGHPDLRVYPFESQLGTRLVNDHLSSTFPVKYRWPVFALDATPAQDYFAIIDEEAKVRLRTPHVSKFRDAPMDCSDDERRDHYVKLVTESERSRGGNVGAFFRATFAAWHDYHAFAHPDAKAGRAQPGDAGSVYVGYSPVMVVDADKIVQDMPRAHVLHVVRNPWSAYADTKKRPVPMSLASYMLGWTLNQYFALLYRELFPGRVHIIRAEDLMANPRQTLAPVLGAMGVDEHAALEGPSWNGTPLREVYPWGTIRRATPEANLATAEELTEAERAEVRLRAGHYLQAFDYASFI